jgi:hypothetical protein
MPPGPEPEEVLAWIVVFAFRIFPNSQIPNPSSKISKNEQTDHRNRLIKVQVKCLIHTYKDKTL